MDFCDTFLLDEDMKILLWDCGDTMILEDVMHKSEVKDRATNISRKLCKYRPLLIIDSYMIFQETLTTLRIWHCSTDDMVLEHKFAH